MNVINSVRNYVSNALDFNQATLSGSIDIIAVRDEADGKIRCTPFHVRFGKLQVLKSKEKIVRIRVNGELKDNCCMKLGAAGEAFFVHRVSEKPTEEDYCTSPLSSPALKPWDSYKDESSDDLRSTVAMKQLKLDSNHLEDAPEKIIMTDKIQGEAQWHDAYRVFVDKSNTNDSIISKTTVSNPSLAEGIIASNPKCDSNSEAEGWWSWGWGDLPTVRTLSSVEESDVTERPLMVHDMGISEGKLNPPIRNCSQYFDANDMLSSPEAKLPTVNTFCELRPMMSTCAHLIGEATDEDSARRIFKENEVSFERFQSDPFIFLDDPNLVFMINGKMYPWQIASSFLVSLAIYGKPLSTQTLEKYVSLSLNNKEIIVERDKKMQDEVTNSWFGWFRPQSSSSNIGRVEKSMESKLVQPVINRSVSSPTELSEDDENMSTYYRKSLRPTESQLKEMGLKQGPNDIEFTVFSSLQGKRSVTAVLYLWDSHTKIVVSDIDGTISKSNVLGQIMPIVGKDWAREGVTSLYANIVANGYQLVYLTSRAIGQTGVTKDYLEGIIQDDVQLPKGPVLLSPDRLMKSFTRYRNQLSTEFRIAALSAIRSLFPRDINPFYAGFGNTVSDQIAYSHVGIPEGRSFILDADGYCRSSCNNNYRKSYKSMKEMVDLMFPPIAVELSGTSSARRLVEDAYFETNFWKIPIPVLENLT